MPEEGGSAVDPVNRIPITAMLKRLRFKMVSLQSHRSQCCCCAVGVFAAMFGIFMLSAGICIVLNVTFMEVDTSGLPPDLHNDSGKKIVGIILICVALVFLGLSATVSILYFTMCSRKNQTLKTARNNGKAQLQRQTNGAVASGHDRPASRENSLPTPTRVPGTNVDMAKFSRSKRHFRSDYSIVKAYRGPKNIIHRRELPPHPEEDHEATRTDMELELANDKYLSRRRSQGKVLQVMANGTGKSDSEVVNSLPTISVQNYVGGDYSETQLNDTGSVLEEDSVSNTYSDVYEEANSLEHFTKHGTVFTGISNKSYSLTNELNSSKQKSLQIWDLSDPALDHSHNSQVQPGLSTSGLSLNMSLRSSQPVNKHHFVTVRSIDETDVDLPLPKIELVQDSSSDSRSSFNSAPSIDDNNQGDNKIERLQQKIKRDLGPVVSG